MTSDNKTEVRERADDLKLVNEPEGANLEHLSRVNLSAVGRTVCAFLNSTGGRIMVGVEDTGRVVGVSDVAAAITSIEREVFSRVQPPAACVVSQVTTGERTLLLVEVAAGADGPYTYNSIIYVRDGEATRKATAEQVRSIVRELDISPRWEAQTTLLADVDDLDKAELARTAEDVYRRRYEALPAEPERLLDALYLVRGGALTNAALVLFSPEVARYFPQTRVRAVHYADESREQFVDNQFFSGHIFALFESLTGFLQKNLSVQASLRETVDGARAEWVTYPPDALREALLNALIHRDYSRDEGSIRLTMFPGRLEIWNSGELPAGVTVKTLREGGISHLRNSQIANVLLLRGMIERMGTGGRRILALCKEAGLPAPKWEERGGGTQLTFRLPGKGVVKPGAADASSLAPLNPRIRDFVIGLAPGQRFTARDYQQQAAADVSDRQARMDLAQLLHAAIIVRYGSGPHTYYARAEQELPEDKEPSSSN